MFDRASDTFKLNLFPIAFHGDREELWEHWLFEKTGFATKSLYRAWCQAHRFPVFRSWVETYRPRVIIGTSRSYETEFAMAFGGAGERLFANMKLLKHGDHRVDLGEGRTMSWVALDEGQTLLVVTPFLGGRWGLHSDALMKRTGEKIAELEQAQLAS